MSGLVISIHVEGVTARSPDAIAQSIAADPEKLYSFLRKHMWSVRVSPNPPIAPPPPPMGPNDLKPPLGGANDTGPGDMGRSRGGPSPWTDPPHIRDQS